MYNKMSRKLTLHQLSIFLILAKHQSMTKAAKELHMSTPALSIQIKQMAEAIGVPLYEQIGRQLYLTDAGRRVENAAADILQRLESLGYELDELQGMERGSLKLSIITTAKYFIPRLLGEFCRQHPGIDVALEILNQDQCISRLSRNLDDLYIMGRVPDEFNVKATPFMENPLVVLAAAGHPLAGEKNVEPACLAEEAFIMREQGSGTRLAAEQFFQKHNVRIKPRMTLGSNEAVKQAVAAGLGLAVLSQHTLFLDESSGAFSILDVKGFPLSRHWFAIQLQGKRETVVTQAFLAHIMQ